MKNKFGKFWNEFLEIIKRKEMSILPAHLAYYFIISIIPAFTIIFYVASLFHIPTTAISNFLSETFTKSVSDTLIKHMNDPNIHSSIKESRDQTLGIIMDDYDLVESETQTSTSFKNPLFSSSGSIPNFSFEIP